MVLLPGARGTDLYNPDEPREAQIAREMYLSRDWLVPRLNGEPFLEKPPLFHWLVAASYRLMGGPSELAARLVPAAATMLYILLTYLFGCRLVGERAAALAAVVLATAIEVVSIGRHTMIDMPLAAAVTLACGALFRATAAAGRERLAWLALGYGAMAAASLFKGVVGAGIPCLALLAFLLLRGDVRGIHRLGLIPGALLSLAPFFAWAVLIGRRLGPRAQDEVLWVNNVLRFTGGAQKGHVQGPLYYAASLLGDFAPWSILLLAAAVAAALAATTLRSRTAPGLLFVLAWLAAPLFVLSMASTKRGLYLLPIFPAAALLVGWWAAEHAVRRLDRLAGAVTLAAVLLMAGMLVAVAVSTGKAAAAGLAAAGVAIPGAAALHALRSGRRGRFVASAGIASALVYAGAGAFLIPHVVDGEVSARGSAAALRRLADRGVIIGVYAVKEGDLGELLFYGPERLVRLPGRVALRKHLRSGGLALMYADVHGLERPLLRVPTRTVGVVDPASWLVPSSRPVELVAPRSRRVPAAPVPH